MRRKTMRSDFLELLQCFTEQKLTGAVNENKDFAAIVSRMELVFNPGNNPKHQLKPDKFCPIVTSGTSFKYVILGLNPHDDGKAGELKHLTTWEQLAEYHTPSNLHGNNIFGRVLGDPGPVVPYYRNVGLLINSLEQRKFVSWPEFRNGGSHADTKKKYVRLIEQSPLAVVELIPFASEKFSLSRGGLEELLHNEVRINNYLLKLTDLILNQSARGAWIICNGNDACNAFRNILELLNISCSTPVHILPEKKYSYHSVNGKNVLMLHEFLKRRGGALNSNEQIRQMLEHVIKLSSVPEDEDKDEG
jgi:hypothetical protein